MFHTTFQLTYILLEPETFLTTRTNVGSIQGCRNSWKQLRPSYKSASPHQLIYTHESSQQTSVIPPPPPLSHHVDGRYQGWKQIQEQVLRCYQLSYSKDVSQSCILSINQFYSSLTHKLYLIAPACTFSVPLYSALFFAFACWIFLDNTQSKVFHCILLCDNTFAFV